MTRRKKRNRNRKRSSSLTENAVLLKAHNIYTEYYEISQDTATLVALANFSKDIKNKTYKLPEADGKLKDTDFLTQSIKDARVEVAGIIAKTAEKTQNDFKTVLSEIKIIKDNTKTVRNLTIAVGVSSVFFLASNFTSPFINRLLQPSVDKIFNRARGEVTKTIATTPTELKCMSAHKGNVSYFITDSKVKRDVLQPKAPAITAKKSRFKPLCY